VSNAFNTQDFKRCIIAALLMVFTAVSTAVVQPAPATDVVIPDLDRMLPEDFADWRRVPISDAVLPAETSLMPGEAIGYRAYVNGLGRVVTLIVAYGPPLGDSVRLHRPERCYVAQGFEIKERIVSSTSLESGEVATVHMLTQSPTRREAVSYWLRSGSSFLTNAQNNQLIRLRRGVNQPLDGALIRVSSKGADSDQFVLHENFLKAFYQALDADGVEKLMGRTKNEKVLS